MIKRLQQTTDNDRFKIKKLVLIEGVLDFV